MRIPAAALCAQSVTLSLRLDSPSALSCARRFGAVSGSEPYCGYSKYEGEDCQDQHQRNVLLVDGASGRCSLILRFCARRFDPMTEGYAAHSAGQSAPIKGDG
jgi:hypothetical protein